MMDPVGRKGPMRRITDTTPSRTSFFRDPYQYRALCLVLERVFGGATGASKVRIWVPGCSDGREPYSIAMIIRQKRFHTRTGAIKILATDTRGDLLAYARKGIYFELDDRFEDRLEYGNHEIVEQYKKTWFDICSKEGEKAFMVKGEIRDMVEYIPDDLRQPKRVSGKFKIISCHNLLRYFHGEVQERAAHTLLEHLSPAGFLVTNEDIFVGREGLRQLPMQENRSGYTAYQKESK